MLPVMNQAVYPGAADVDDCWVVASVWAVKYVAPFLKDLPTVPEFREAANDPDDGIRDGGSLDEVMRGLRGIWPKAPFIRYQSMGSTALLDYLDKGRAASVAVSSRLLPSRLRFGFLGAHQIALVKSGEKFFVMNPLARDGSQPLEATFPEVALAARALNGGEIRAAITPTPAQAKEALMAGLAVEIVRSFNGKVRVRGSGHVALQIADPSRRFVLKDGELKTSIAIGRLVPSLEEQLGRAPLLGHDRSTVHVIGDQLAIVLAADVEPLEVPMVAQSLLTAETAKLAKARVRAVTIRAAAGDILEL